MSAATDRRTSQSRGKALIGNLLVMLVSFGIALILCEIGARFFLNTANYLSVSTVPDPVLGITIPPGTAGFDQWGFRNPSVPERADVVAVGDSHTFGNTARMEDAWPSVVARETGLTVYNLGLGGYGPNQYYRLMMDRGLALHPTWVLCGLYMGDDFENAFSMTYGLEKWAYLREGSFAGVDANIWGTSEAPSFNKRLRNWLSRNSLIYQILVHGPLLAKAKENVEFARAQQGKDPVTTALVVENKNIREAFRPAGMVTRLDQNSAPVREGMRITFRLLLDMKNTCAEKGCRFAVVIIPTKETVFAGDLEGKSQIHLHESLDKVIANERVARKKLTDFLDTSAIPYVDALAPLRNQVGNELYARTTNDMHPGRNGYKVIGDAVAMFLKQQKQKP